MHLRVGLPMLAEVYGVLSEHDLDGSLPPPLATNNTLKSAYDELVELGRFFRANQIRIRSCWLSLLKMFGRRRDR